MGNKLFEGGSLSSPIAHEQVNKVTISQPNDRNQFLLDEKTLLNLGKFNKHAKGRANGEIFTFFTL